MGTIFVPSWPSELFDGLYFDYVKSADFGSEKKFLVQPFFIKKLPFSVAPSILPLKLSNRAFEAFWWLQKAKSSYVRTIGILVLIEKLCTNFL